MFRGFIDLNAAWESIEEMSLEAASRRRFALLAFLSLAVAYAGVVQRPGWNQFAHAALVTSLVDGTPRIDEYHWVTGDKSYIDGHYYATKAPGLAFASLPVGLAGRALDADVFDGVGETTPVILSLTLWGAALPALILFLLVRRLAEELEPGLGTLTAATLGLGTLILPFATLFFAHALSTCLGFAAFVLLWRERRGPQRLSLVAASGLVAGLAVNAEYPLALAGAVMGGYAIARPGWLRRGVVYASGAILGAAPLFLYNRWAFGSITKFPYENAVLVQGRSGHDVIGANDEGFFGLTVPSGRAALELLFASKGLLTLSPILAVAAVGVVLLYRRGLRAEALTIGAVTLAFLLYNSAYYLPFGGYTPGPRFLVPILPFLAVSLALAFRRLPVTTASFAAVSAGLMVSATVARPQLPGMGTREWLQRIIDADYDMNVSVLSKLLGPEHGWLVPVPLVVAALATALFADLASDRLPFRREMLTPALAAVFGWAVVAVTGQMLLERNDTYGLVLLTGLVTLVVLVVLKLHEKSGRGALHRPSWRA